MPIIPYTTFFKENKEMILQIRQAMLMVVDVLERGLQISPTTAEIREQHKLESKFGKDDKSVSKM